MCSINKYKRIEYIPQILQNIFLQPICNSNQWQVFIKLLNTFLLGMGFFYCCFFVYVFEMYSFIRSLPVILCEFSLHPGCLWLRRTDLMSYDRKLPHSCKHSKQADWDPDPDRRNRERVARQTVTGWVSTVGWGAGVGGRWRAPAVSFWGRSKVSTCMSQPQDKMG